MSTGNALPRLDIKDLAVLVPLLGSGLAVTYEIGSFYPLGAIAFGLFSLSEHLLGALAAFPIVLALLGTSILAYWQFSIVTFRRSLRRRRPDEGRRKKRINNLILFALVGLGAILVWAGWKNRSAFYIAVGLCSFGSASLAFLPRSTRIRLHILMLVVAFAFLLAGAVGVDHTRKALLSRCVAEFAFKDGVKSAVLVRSGERGILLYDPARNQFTFDKWDDLKSIGWPFLSRLREFSILPVPPDIDRARSACDIASSRRPAGG